MICVYFGSPGCGKTTHIMYLITKQIKYLSSWKYRLSQIPVFSKLFTKQSDRFYTNVKDCVFPYCASSEIGKTVLPRGSTYYIDEAGIDFNNRKYKTLSQDSISYLKLHRHYGHDINFYSQSWEDMDVTIRRLAERYYYLKKVGPFTLCRRVRKVVTVDTNTQQIIDGYKFTGILWRLLPKFLGGFKSFYFIFRPKYYKFFDSYAIENPLPNYQSEPVRVTHAHKPLNICKFFRVGSYVRFIKRMIKYYCPWNTSEFRGI